MSSSWSGILFVKDVMDFCCTKALQTQIICRVVVPVPVPPPPSGCLGEQASTPVEPKSNIFHLLAA